METKTRSRSLFEAVIFPDGLQLPAVFRSAASSVVRARQSDLATTQERELVTTESVPEPIRTAQGLSRQGLGIRTLGWAPLFEERRLAPGKYTDWEVRPLRSGETVDIPEKAMTALVACERAGLRFDRLYWAEEFEKPELDRPVGPITPSQGLAAAGTLATVAAGIALFPLLAAAMVLSGTDPALLGVLEHPAQPGVGYFVLIAKWNH